MDKWSIEKIENWHENQPWIRGFCGYPSNCVNRVAIWQSYNHEAVLEQIRYEFDLAKKTGLNATRAVVLFEVWLYEHDAFMQNLEDYISAAATCGIKVMLVIGNDCCVPKEFYSFSLGEQKVDWGYHSGIKRGQHSATHGDNVGYLLIDEPEYLDKFYEMVRELAQKYGRDERVQVWNVWNEIGNNNRKMKSVPYMEKCFEILREREVIQPLTAEVWSFDDTFLPHTEWEKRAVELSDIVSFHYYGSFQNMVKIIENLRSAYRRPILNTEWLNRIEHNDVDEIFPLFYLEKVGSYFWGLIQGYSQTYEPWGCYMDEIADANYHGDHDLTKLQHDLYRFNGLPYIAREVEIIKDFASRADKKFNEKN